MSVTSLGNYKVSLELTNTIGLSGSYLIDIEIVDTNPEFKGRSNNTLIDQITSKVGVES